VILAFSHQLEIDFFFFFLPLDTEMKFNSDEALNAAVSSKLDQELERFRGGEIERWRLIDSLRQSLVYVIKVGEKFGVLAVGKKKWVLLFSSNEAAETYLNWVSSKMDILLPNQRNELKFLLFEHAYGFFLDLLVHKMLAVELLNKQELMKRSEGFVFNVNPDEKGKEEMTVVKQEKVEEEEKTISDAMNIPAPSWFKSYFDEGEIKRK